MKKIYYILFALLGCSSCDDLLDVKPENSVTFTNFFTSELELESAAYQMMGSVCRNYSYSTHEIMGEKADKAQSYYTGIRMLNPQSVGGGGWQGLYDVIYMANVILDDLGRAENVPQDRLDFHRGEAEFIKSLSYFHLSRRYGEAVITKNSKTYTAYGRSSVLAVIDTCIAGALRAYHLLPVHEDLRDRTGAAITSKQYGSKGSAATLLAHAYAWKGSIIDLYGFQGSSKECYEQAIYWASEILENRAGTYGLVDPETLCNLFSSPRTYNAASIFEIELNEMSMDAEFNGIGKVYISWPVNENEDEGEIDYKDLVIYQTTVDQMYEDQDLRKNAYFYTPDYPVETECAYPYKWREGYYNTNYGGKDWQTLLGNTVYWRLSDVYLLRAECYAKLGNAKAIDDLNTIRGHVHATLYPAAGESDIQLAIFREREKELLFEGHRYYDVIRNGEKYIRSELSTAFRDLSADDIRNGALYLPLSTDAFTLNEYMRQNVYWAQFTD